MTGSSMMFLMYWVDPKEHILKVLSLIFIFGLNITVCYNFNKNVTNRQTSDNQTNTFEIYIRYYKQIQKDTISSIVLYLFVHCFHGEENNSLKF